MIKKDLSYYRDLVEMANSIILRWDTRGHVTFLNEFGERFFLYHRSEIIGRHVVGTIVPETDSAGKELVSMIRDICSHPDRFVRNENENMKRTGERAWVMWTNKPLKDGNGRIAEILSVGNDITERKQMEEALRKSRSELEARITERTVELARMNEDLRGQIADRRIAEEGLRESEERYRIAIEYSNDGVAMIRGPQHLYVNQKYVEIFGYENRQAVLLKSIGDFVHPDDREWVERINAARQNGEYAPPRYEFKGIKQNGDAIYIEVSATMIVYGGYPASLAFLRDITERKKAQERIERLNNLLRAGKNITEALLRVKSEPELLERTCRLLAQVEFIRFVWAGFTDEETAGVKPVAHAGFEKGYLSRIKVTRDDSDYGKGPTGTSIKTGKPSIIDDVEKDPRFAPWRKEALKRGYQSVIALPLNHKGDVIGYLTAYSGWKNAFQKEEVEFLTQVAEDVALGIKSLRLEIELERKHRELQDAYMELKASEAKIIQQEKMASIGQMAAGIVHEINNPMGFLISNLQTLKDRVNKIAEVVGSHSRALEKASTSKQKEIRESARLAKAKEERLNIEYIPSDTQELIEECLDGGDRIKVITRDLREFSREGDNEYRLADVNTCLESAIHMVWNELRYKAQLHKIYGDVPPVKCNPAQLSQVFINLLVNASQAIEGFGDITIMTSHDGRDACVTMSDTGCGMGGECLGRIFEPFFTTKEAGKGTGLGLSIAYDIVRKHGGDITVESAIGKGSTFVVRIPVDGQIAA